MENPMNKKEFWDALSTTPWENRNCANCKHYDPYTYNMDKCGYCTQEGEIHAYPHGRSVGARYKWAQTSVTQWEQKR